MLLGAGVGMCLLAYPASVLANGTSVTQPLAATSKGVDTCGYPNASNSTVFNENTLATWIQTNGTGLSATISAYGNDEKGILLGVTDPASSATVTALGTVPGHASNPSLGDLNKFDASGRPQYPAIFVTNLTQDGAGSTAGDWQQGGAAQAKVSDVFGAWTAGVYDAQGNYGKPVVPSGTNKTGTNTYNLGNGSDAPKGVLASSANEAFGVEFRWNVSDLVDDHGNALAPGNTYRFQVFLHDGDQNKDGGDAGELCTTLMAPAPTPGNLLGLIKLCDNGSQTATEVPGGTVSSSNSLTGSDSGSGVSFSNLAPGQYPVSAGAPAGYRFVTCGSTDFTPSSDKSTASYNNPVTVPAGGTGTATFFVEPIPAPPGPNFVVSKSVAPSGSVPINTALTYTVTVRNTGGQAGSPGSLSDVLKVSGGATYTIATAASSHEGSISCTGVCTTSDAAGSASTWTWDLSHSTLGAAGSPNAEAKFTVTVLALTPGTLSNSAVLPGSNCPQGDMPPPCSTSTPVNLILKKVNDPTDAQAIALGTKVHYTITLENPTDNDAKAVVMTDVMTGTAKADVDQTSFQASVPLAGSVQCQVSDCTSFTWTWDVNKHSMAVLTYDATITSDGTSSSTVNGVTMINTVSTPGLPPVTVQNHTPVSGVQGITNPGTPNSGAFPEMNVSVAGFMLLGGLTLILSGVLVRRPRLGEAEIR